MVFTLAGESVSVMLSHDVLHTREKSTVVLKKKEHTHTSVSHTSASPVSKASEYPFRRVPSRGPRTG